jgi:hypothetical protein
MMAAVPAAKPNRAGVKISPAAVAPGGESFGDAPFRVRMIKLHRQAVKGPTSGDLSAFTRACDMFICCDRGAA